MELDTARQLAGPAVVAQRVEMADGFTSANQHLLSLADSLSLGEALEVASALGQGVSEERSIGARILIHADIDPHGRLDAATRALNGEEDPRVARWLIAALGRSRLREAILVVGEYVRHPNAQLRFQVPDALSACATDLSDIHEDLLTLSMDSDDDVRWSAVFELGAWYAENPGSETHARLVDAATYDLSEEVRGAARDALEAPAKPPNG